MNPIAGCTVVLDIRSTLDTGRHELHGPGGFVPLG
jgi:hypothetical protein